MNVERLLLVAEICEHVPLRYFDMSLWFRPPSKGCGTTACAIGHACGDERVQATGLRLCSNGGDKVPCYEEEGGMEAVALWAGINVSATEAIFGPDRPSSPIQVAAHIRRFVAEHATSDAVQENIEIEADVQELVCV